MKTIIVSDLHLTQKFDPRKYRFLKNLFNNSDKLVVNGDFWSYYSTTFEEFLNSKWKKLFPLMLRKNTIYIFGNHDRKEWCDQRTNLFSVKQAHRHSFSLDKNDFVVRHGHDLLEGQGENKTLCNLTKKLLHFEDRARYSIESFLYRLVSLNVINKIFVNYNNKAKKFNYNKEFFLITGHSHVAEMDNDYKYINTGFVGHGHAWYLEIFGRSVALRFKRY